MKQLLDISAKKLLLVDGMGALLTATSVGVVMPIFIELIGMPLIVLQSLGGVAGCFVLTSFSFAFLGRLNEVNGLRLMIVLNSLYSSATLLLVWFYFDQLTTLAKAYFFVEVLIVALLVVWELNVVKRDREHLGNKV